MEKLPTEMVALIVQHLSAQDLGRCSAVSRQWRDIFNHDWIWKPLFDHDVEESLRTIPSVEPPVFKLPENSTLPPLCRWKLAYSKERHLWNNWMVFKTMDQDIMPDFHHNECQRIEFLTDIFILVVYKGRVEIYDLSREVAVLVAKSVEYISTSSWGKCVSRGLANFDAESRPHPNSQTALLFVSTSSALMVYNVDAISQSIYEKVSVSLNNIRSHGFKGNYFIGSSEFNSLVLFDLTNVETLNKLYFRMETDMDTVTRYDIVISEFSEFVAIRLMLRLPTHDLFERFHFFNLERLVFLPESLSVNRMSQNRCELVGQYLGVIDYDYLTIYDFITGEILLTKKRLMFENAPKALNDVFVFQDHDEGEMCLKIFSPSNRTLKVLYKFQHANRPTDSFEVKIINKKFIALRYPSKYLMKDVWAISGKTVNKSELTNGFYLGEHLVRCGVEYIFGEKINKSFTKMIYQRWDNIPVEVDSHPSCSTNSSLEYRREIRWGIRNFW